MNHNYKKSEVEKLRGFIATVECGNTVKAGDKIGVSATTISARILSLEQDVGFKLFDRVKNKLTLNDRGKAYYEEAKLSLLSLERIYGKKVKYTESSNIEKVQRNIRIRKMLDKYKKVFRRYLTKLLNMIIKLRLRYIAVVLAILALGLCMAYEMHARGEFYERNGEITKDIANNVLQIEKKMENILENAAMVLEHHVEKNPNINMQELNALCKQLNVDNCGIQDSNGVVVLSSRKDASTPENKLYYQNHSIKDQIKNFDSMKLQNSKSLPSSFYGTEGDVNNGEKRIVKGIDRWNKKLNKILYLKIRSKNIIDTFKNYSLSNDDLLDISFITPSGKVIASISNNYVQINPFERYTEKLSIRDDKNDTSVLISFGGLQDELWTHKSEKERGLTNQSGEYFYTIRAIFSKEKLNHHITMIRITSVIIASIILLILYCVGLKQNGVIDLRKKAGKKKPH